MIRCLDGSRAWHGLVDFFVWLVAVPGMVRLNFWLCGSSLSALSGNRLRHCTDAVLALQWGLVSIGFVASGECLGLMSVVWVKDCVHRLGDGVLFVLCRGHHSSLCVRTGGARQLHPASGVFCTCRTQWRRWMHFCAAARHLVVRLCFCRCQFDRLCLVFSRQWKVGLKPCRCSPMVLVCARA